MHVSEIFDPALLNAEIYEGYITERKHPTSPLWIYNYSPATQWSRRWNAATVNCRGLILDKDWNVVARPFPKFFNYGDDQIDFDLDTPAQVTDKMDGSLGILYQYDPCCEIATRGSFESEQAIHATDLWQEKYFNVIPSPAWTFMFEIIYPGNRIVLDYDGLDDLVLLGAVRVSDGSVIGPQLAATALGWPGPITTVFSHKTLREALSAPARANAEGFVVRSGEKMVKVKQEDYLELHRLVTDLTEKRLWEQLRDGKTKAEILEPLPDEFAKWAEDILDKLTIEYHAILTTLLIEYMEIRNNLVKNATKKDFAMEALQSPNKALLFCLWDGKGTDEAIWKMVKPRGDEV